MTSELQDSAGAAPSGPAPTVEAIKGRRRRLLFRLQRGVRLIEQRERIQDIGYGLLAAALALSVPAAHPYTVGGETVQRLHGEDVVTQGLLFPMARGFTEVVSSATPESTMRLFGGLSFGVAIIATLAFLRCLGFRRTASIPATFAAFFTPWAWIGSTSPIDYGPGLFGASLILWTLFHQEQSTKRGYHWRAVLSFGFAYMLYLETALLVPAVAWAVARHPKYRHEATQNLLAVIIVLVMSIAIGLSGSGESGRMEHLAERALAGADDFSAGAWLQWAMVLPVGLGVILFGLYQLLFAARSVDAKRAPKWIVPWCLVGLAPMVAGSPEFAPIAPYLVPAGALGLADWLNRRGTATREARYGAVLLGLQLAATAAVLLWAAR